MAYEWDDAKARRDHFIKFAIVWVFALSMAGVPFWFLLQAAEF